MSVFAICLTSAHRYQTQSICIIYLTKSLSFTSALNFDNKLFISENALCHVIPIFVSTEAPGRQLTFTRIVDKVFDKVILHLMIKQVV